MSNKQNDQFLDFISEAINEKLDRVEHLLERSKEHPGGHKEIKKDIGDRIKKIQKEFDLK